MRSRHRCCRRTTVNDMGIRLGKREVINQWQPSGFNQFGAERPHIFTAAGVQRFISLRISHLCKLGILASCCFFTGHIHRERA